MSPYPFSGTTLIELLPGSAVQLVGTDALKIFPPLMSWNCADGFGSGWPGVPNASAGPAGSPSCGCGCCLALASSPIDLAAGSDAKLALIGVNPLMSAALAIVRDAASLLM